jgi:biopolymer transport protein ExbB
MNTATLFKQRVCHVLAVFLLVIPVQVFSEDEVSVKTLDIQQLLQRVKQQHRQDQKQQQQRINEFRVAEEQQREKLREAKALLKRQHQLSTRLERDFENNEEKIAIKREQLQQRLGGLTELFGHMTAFAVDLEDDLSVSVTSAQYPGRSRYLQGFVDTLEARRDLPSVEEIENLVLVSFQEMTAASEVVKFKATVSGQSGDQKSRQVLRVGNFTLVADGDYLVYSSGRLIQPGQQPSATLFGSSPASLANEFQSAASGYHPFVLDPSGPAGSFFLKSLDRTPTLADRWKQGGFVGLVISLLAVFAVALSVQRVIVLSAVMQRTREQVGSTEARADNPLGRLLQVYQANRHLELENLEYKLAEVILAERPAIERGVASLKIIAMVAPLLGLLGTVLGMIMTFQAIAVFGAGDPLAMAGGISSALVTTVLGLCVAVPTLLLHSIVNAKARSLVTLLEQQSFGLVAERMEQDQL